MALALRLWQTRIVKTLLLPTRGYFAIGVEGISKAVNLGNLLRSGHAFGASFAFTIGADAKALQTQADTSKASTHLPVYHWRSQAELELPKGCSLVGVEILDAAQDLPSFPHPLRAAYVLGPERGALSPGPRRTLPTSGAHSGRLLSQCRHRRRHCHVRSPAFARALRLAPGGPVCNARAGRGSCARGAEEAPGAGLTRPCDQTKISA